MKIKLTFLFVFITIGYLFYINKQSIERTKQKHAQLIDNNSLQGSLRLTKSERKQQGLPPNKYFEQEYLNEMNPETGKTYPEYIFRLQEELNGLDNRSVPGSYNNYWVERGPNNVPGRTRAIMYDPNDATHKRVFAGSVSGGLWVNNNIELSSTAWQRVNIPENLAISSITYDVNDTNIFYLGTGESYVQGSVNGNGVWKSIDGGATWTHIFGGSTGETTVISNANLTINSGSINGSVYAATQTSNFGPSLTTITGDLAIVNDGTANPTEGCNTLVNGSDINGKIAVIDRGTCHFSAKVKKAQDEGAIAAIIINNVSSFPFDMAAGDDAAAVTIPAVMMGKVDGTVLKSAIINGTINATLNPVTTELPAGIVLIPGKFHINDIVTRNNGGTTEIYAAVSESMYTTTANLLGGEIGLYKSIDGGNTWSMINLPQTSGGHPYAPNDLLVTSDNKLWVATTRSWSFGDGGGTIFSSDDGINFIQKFSDSNGTRTQIAASTIDPNKIYILMHGNTNSSNYFKKTTDGFSTITNLTVPTGFAAQQGYYNLTLSVDPLNDNNVYIGGNYVYKSTNSGNSLNKITHYYNDSSPGSYVHVDTHAIVLHPTDSNKGLIGNDGGVYYMNSSGAIIIRDNGYNTTQYYRGAIGQSTTNERFIGGAQDNGTNMINNATAGINSSTTIGIADGMHCFIDKDGQYMITSIYYNVYDKIGLNGNSSTQIVSNQNEGQFVNIAELDDNLDILYTDASVRASDGSVTGKISRFSNLNGTIARFDITDDLLTRPVSAMRVSPYTTNFSTLFVGTDIGEIFKVTRANGGHPTWIDLTPEPYVTPFRGSISSINFGSNENEIMVTFHNYGVVNVFFTEDGGATWQNKEGDLPDLPIKDILMNPLLNDEVIIATDLGVWKTSNFKDTNPHWVRAHNGMQNVKVTSFDLRTSDNTILASTYGRGLFTGQFTSTASTNDFTTNNKEIEVYPTLSSGLINLKSSQNLDNSSVQVFDVNGRKVFDTTLDISSSAKSINLNINQGIYFVNISNNDLKESHKIIIK